MKIILSVDDSVHSKFAVDDVRRGFWPEGTEVLIATAVWAPFGFIPPAPEAAEKMVADAAEKLRTNSTIKEVHTQVLTGNPKAHILRLANETKADLLVVGSRKPAITKLLFGSTSHALMLSAPCSVRISREQKKHSKPIVLIGFDGSEYGWRALEVMYARPWPDGTRLVVLNAVPTVSDASFDNPHVFSMDELEKGRRRLREIAEKEIGEAATMLRERIPQVLIEAKILDGDPSDALIQAANEYDADLIVVGTQGRNFSAYLAIGSVSEGVAVGASCSVEIVKSATPQH